MPDVVIRPAESADIETCAELLSLLFSIEEDFAIDRSRQLKGLEMVLESPGAQLLVACDSNNEVVGMCSGQLTISTAEGGPAVLVEDVVVRKDLQGRGIGSMLMKAVTRWAQSMNATRMQLLADTQNTAALNFYAAKGWETTQLICLRSMIQEFRTEHQTGEIQ